MKSIVTGWPSTLPSSQFAGPKGRRRNRSKKPPTITGLMKSGITNSTIRPRRPRNGRIMASASTKPSASSTATQVVARNAVTQSECTHTGSFQFSL